MLSLFDHVDCDNKLITYLLTLLALTLRHESLPDWSSAYGRTPKSDTTVDMVDTVDMVVAYLSSIVFKLMA